MFNFNVLRGPLDIGFFTNICSGLKVLQGYQRLGKLQIFDNLAIPRIELGSLLHSKRNKDLCRVLDAVEFTNI